MADLKKYAEQLVNLTVKEVNELTKIFKEEHGIEPLAIGPSPVITSKPEAPVEEKTSFDVILKPVTGTRPPVIRAVKNITGLKLIEAKELVDKAPSPIKKGVNKNEAEEIKKEFEKAGAQVELK